ncbi:MAG TPA: hypothetical protein VK501_00795 [Baekduia sp.]|uniref:hypothetical protein n=1 Tax=Baekduia sp. TaxID=2600305 RepID=UPI002BB85B45|nr:hypothetical protein [Baekduia sp.]HMJ32424.1 hypothetical protein [Baekduia sp.]
MRAPRRLLAGWSGEGLGDYEVDRHAVPAQPPTGIAGRVCREVRVLHRLLDQRFVPNDADVEGDVRVFGRLGERDDRRAGSEVQRLCADDDDRVGVRCEGLEGVKERRRARTVRSPSPDRLMRLHPVEELLALGRIAA